MRSLESFKYRSTRAFHCSPLRVGAKLRTADPRSGIPQGIPRGPAPEQTGIFGLSRSSMYCATVCAFLIGPISPTGYLVRRRVEMLLGNLVFRKLTNSGVSTVMRFVVVSDERSVSRLPKKNILSFCMGPPSENPNSFRREAGRMRPVIGSGV